MRYSGLMPSARPAASLSTKHSKRLRKQIVFKIGDTIHSGPSLVAPALPKDENINPSSKCVFPSNLQESTRISLDSDHLAQIPSTTPCSPQSSETLCHSSPAPCTPCIQNCLGTKGSLPAAHVPDIIVPKTNVSKASNIKTVRSSVVKRLGNVKSCTLEAVGGECVSNIIEPQDCAGETRTVEVKICEPLIPQGKLIGDFKSKTSLRNETTVEIIEGVHPVIKKEPDEAQDPPIYLNTFTISPVKNEILTSTELEIAKLSTDIKELHERKPEVYEAIQPEFNKGQLLFNVGQRTSAKTVVNSLNLTTDLSEAGLIEENKEMVRLIQEADTKLDSFYHKRSNRVSKRISSAEFDVIEIKQEPVSRARRCTRTRKCSCRSDKSESETSDSRSVADESLYIDMVDKTAKPGKPKNGEHLLDEATTHVSAKYNGDASSEIANGAHKVKGRRVSRTNSDESDSNCGSKTNGNIDHNGDRVDISVLLEISPADRKKFESKKAKIRRKTADWLLISETEQYYNEKEEIMRNKNKLESGSESDESDACTENHDSQSECSDESESTAGSSKRTKGKGKPTRTAEDDPRPNAKRQKEDVCPPRKRGRPVGGRTRKTLYDLTMLNDDDDDEDDENFFGFPVSTTIPQSTRTSCTVSGSASQTRSKVKESCKHVYDVPPGSSKAGRKRLSDAERFLRDNREYYHFQETPERLRRSTSSSAEKEKTGRLDGCEVKEVEKKEEPRPRDPPPPPVCKKRPVVDGRRVTRSAGVILEEPNLQGKPKVKSVEKDDTKSLAKSADKADVKEKDRRKVSDDDIKKFPEGDKRKVSDGDTKKFPEGDKRKVSNNDDRKVSDDDIKKFPEGDKRKFPEGDKRKVSNNDDRKVSDDDIKKFPEGDKRKFPEGDKRKVSDDIKKFPEGDKRKVSDDIKKFPEDDKRKFPEDVKRKVSDDIKKFPEDDKRKFPEDDKRKVPEDDKRKVPEDDKRKVSDDDTKKLPEDDKIEVSEDDKRKVSDDKRKVSDDDTKKLPEDDKRKVSEDDVKKFPEDHKRKGCEGKKRKRVDDSPRLSSECAKRESGDKKDSDVRKPSELESRTSESAAECSELEERTRQLETSSSVPVVSKSECTESKGRGRLLRAEARDSLRSDLQDLYFSFEGIPEQESWYQTYQRLIDGVTNNEFSHEEDPLKFVLPYEMPKEYVRDFLCYKGLLSKKKNDLAELVRKSPRCHASTLALFSDIIPTKRIKNTKVLRSGPPKVEEVSSDGTSTPGAESTKLPPTESFESAEELAILALHIDHIMKAEGCCEEVPVCSLHTDDLKETEGLDYKKTPLKKRGKKKRLLTVSKSEKSFENTAKELKVFDSSLTQEIDPVFIAGLCDDMKDFLIPENILSREASEVVEDSCFCVCTDRASCDEFSSADDNTEASSECVSLCDSETIDCSVVSEPKRGRSAKKRRKNLTGWPKTQKRKKPAPSHTSDDNDSALGWDDLEPKKHMSWKKQQNFNLIDTSERLAALAACDRRASPRKKASVLYMDTWPVRFRTQK